MKKERRSTGRVYPERPIQMTFDCGEPVIGRVHNISNHGIAVEYNATLISCRDMEEVSAQITVDQQSRLKVEDLCCTAIYDISTLAHDQSFRGVNMRLCGLRFKDLSQTQHNRLHQILASI